jgi:hypothetical protein
MAMRLAESTRKQYRRGLEKFQLWRGRNGLEALDVVKAVERYLVFLFLDGKGGQVKQAKSALASMFAEVRGDESLMKLSSGIYAQWKLCGGGREPRDPIPKEALIDFIKNRPEDYDLFHWLRDRFLALTAVRLMRRPAEMLGVYIDHIEYDHDRANRDWLWFYFAKSKNDRLGINGRKNWAPIEGSGSKGLDIVDVANAYLRVRPAVGGPLWVESDGAWVGKDHLNKLAKFIAARSGRNGNYTAYSFRIAGASWAAAAGLTTAEIQAMGGWRSEAVHVYIRAVGSAAADASARMGL